MDNQINGLKYQVARQRNMKLDFASQLDKCEDQFTAVILKHKDEDAAWEYWGTRRMVWHGNSERLGLASIIRDYTTKDGKRTFPAHFTHCGRYMGSVKKLGDKPISYTGNFVITREKFRVDFSRENIKHVEDLFTPR